MQFSDPLLCVTSAGRDNIVIGNDLYSKGAAVVEIIRTESRGN